MMSSSGIGNSQHWADVKEAGAGIGMKALYYILVIFGVIPVYIALYPVILYFFLFKAAARRASREYLENLAVCYPELKIKSSSLIVFKHFLQFANLIVDKVQVWMGRLNIKDLEFSGKQIFTEHINNGTGALLVGSHHGNIEVCRGLSRQVPGVKINVLVHTKHALKFNSLLSGVDASNRMNLIQVTEIDPATIIFLKEKIDGGEFVVIAGDRIPISSDSTQQAEFLGRRADFPVGPYVLAMLLGCPIVLIFCIKNAGRYTMYFEKFADKVKRVRRDRDVVFADLAQRYAKRLEHYCKLAPLQWGNFFPFWSQKGN
ncbi:MAG: hypothetical protein D6B27_04635 [Gammaproteobacteria bacterium]|nr:MAG: hypothetical protein D6B27_04635 [Gammaproteobacteria bacterium]